MLEFAPVVGQKAIEKEMMVLTKEVDQGAQFRIDIFGRTMDHVAPLEPGKGLIQS